MALFASDSCLESYQDKKFIQAINEVYFGRTPGINSLFNAYCDWREPLVSKSKYFTASSKNIYNKEMKFFLDKVCKQFGFKSFSYTVINSSNINSFTIFGIIPNRTAKMIEITKEGYKFKSDTNIHSIVGVFPDLVFNPYYTSAENFAIFLHEIGHNFQTAANQSMLSLSAATGVLTMLTDIIKGNLITPLVGIAISSEESKSAINTLMNTFLTDEILGAIYSVTGLITYSFSYIMNIIRSIGVITTRPINLIINALRELLQFMIDIVTGDAAKGYYGERFSDGFAASYGFGADLQTALGKMSGHGISSVPILDDILGTIPLFGHLYSIACLPGLILWHIIDVHPSNEDRMYGVLKDLKQDLNDPNITPEMKKQLTKEIADYEKAMNDFFDANRKFSNASVVTSLMQEAIYKKCGGSLKFKISELPYLHKGGFRADTNDTANKILNTKII